MCLFHSDYLINIAEAMRGEGRKNGRWYIILVTQASIISGTRCLWDQKWESQEPLRNIESGCCLKNVPS